MRSNARFTKDGLGLFPVGTDARRLMSNIQNGSQVFIEVWKPRNMKQHRKYFGLLNRVVEATGRWTSQEHLRRDILDALHRYDDEINSMTGEVRRVYHSMKVASMARDDFERLYDDTMRLLADALGCDPEMLLEDAA